MNVGAGVGPVGPTVGVDAALGATADPEGTDGARPAGVGTQAAIAVRLTMIAALAITTARIPVLR
jgi:hypothetical protein